MVTGLSPRVRGNRIIPAARRACRWSIPACAGEPRRRFAKRDEARVYPRVCGGTHVFYIDVVNGRGLSPRVRGNRATPASPGATNGSIPACAGEPPPLLASQCRSWGLSPRVRGNHPIVTCYPIVTGSIPACAGEPPARPTTVDASRVYPRVCGGTAIAELEEELEEGLSPRVRGNRGAGSYERRAGGSIPACAGEPRTLSRRTRGGGVYPRVCGGTAKRLQMKPQHMGLSPRVRGNPCIYRLRGIRVGSIPACAGEPRAGVAARDESRSIPACAGEPAPCTAPGHPAPVYPRVCGGTFAAFVLILSSSGLSPRVRGNRYERKTHEGGNGSIPACAGEPVLVVPSEGRLRVYPRVCGGTQHGV